MAVFDTFYLLFESDVSKLVKGEKEAGKSADEVKKKLTDVDKQAEKLGGKFTSLIKDAAKIAIGSLALSSLKNMTMGVAEQNAELGKQAAALRMNVGRMQEWQGAFEGAGSSAETFNALFARIGQTTRDPEARILRIADSMSRMGERQRFRYGKHLGLDAEAIALLAKGKKGIDELLKKERELGLVTQDEVKASKAFNEQMRVAGRLFGDVKNRIGMGLLPVFNWLMMKFSAFIRAVRDNKAFIAGFFAMAAAMILKLYLPAILTATKATLLWLAPYLAIAAAAAAIALILDDITVYLQGGDSLLGRWIAKSEKTSALVRFIKSALEGVKIVFDALTGKAQDLQLAIEGIVRTFSSLKGFTGFLKHLVGKDKIVEEKIDPAEVEAQREEARKRRQLVESAEKGQSILSQTNTLLASQTSNVVNNSRAGNVSKSNTVNVGTVNVQTQATDSDGIAKGIGDSLQNQFSSATNQFDDGVLA
ncbi:MAG: hypothetical protein LBJ76_04070 [Candidatus Accumulibacter sp.]|jgi:hypothetical protein|nr:hypothetical protein [Accumulibacter sp.]